MEVARADQEHPTIRRRRYEEIARADQEINSHEEAPRRGNRRCGRNTESGPLENGRVAVRDGSDLHLSQTLAVRCRPLDLADGVVVHLLPSEVCALGHEGTAKERAPLDSQRLFSRGTRKGHENLFDRFMPTVIPEDLVDLAVPTACRQNSLVAKPKKIRARRSGYCDALIPTMSWAARWAMACPG